MASDLKDSPFLLVEHGKDGLWHVHDRRFDTAGILFKERQEACDYASERARTREGSIVLLREHQNAVTCIYEPDPPGMIERVLSWIWRS